MLKIDKGDFKITKICEGKVHFKVKNLEYFIILNYLEGTSTWKLFQKKRKDGYGRNKIVFLNKKVVDYTSKGRNFIYRNNQPNSHYIRTILLVLSYLGFATTIFTPYIEEQQGIQNNYEAEEMKLAEKVKVLRETRDKWLAKIDFEMSKINL